MSATLPIGQSPSIARPGLVWGVFVLSLFSLLLAGYVSSVGAMVFLALWVMMALGFGHDAARVLHCGPRLPWVIACLAVASTLWSQAPGETLKFGLEYTATVACALLAAGMMRPRALLSALAAALMAVAVLSVARGTHAIDPLTGADTFVGVFASKNQLGFFVSLLLLAGIALLLDGAQPAIFRLMGLGAIALALPLLVMSHSGTSVVSSGLAALVLLANLCLSRVSRFTRARLFCAGLCVATPLLALLAFGGDDISGLLLDALGKDATLTGRTTLWQHALALIPDHPILGIGYQAFWLQNDMNAESLWHAFHIESRSGFHFHSTWIETTVEIGLIGAGLLLALVLRVAADLLRWSWRTGSVPSAFFVALLFCLITRAFVEVDILGPFLIGTFMLLVAASYARQSPEEAAT